ncbi:MAG: FKBP-type peptidyl-prolyl cis-trans isomerase [Lachnospiraceae bacterium]|nr:FKBP-type peptidyl-prolyl cis-trans isomerase [Lachnospiraceae bacterium]
MKKENKALARQKKAQAKKRQAVKKKVLLIGGIALAVILVVVAAVVIKRSNDEANAPETLKFSKYLTKDGMIKNIDIEDYVKLCNLEENLQFKAEDVEPSEEEILELMEGYLSSHRELNTEAGVVAEDGDTVQIRYVGKVDDVAFEGGSTGEEGTSLTLGSGTYIDDFEDQLVGKSVGDEVLVEVTFPENYGNEALNGKDAVFEVTILGVYQLEITDELVAENVEGCTTVEEYREKARQVLFDDTFNSIIWYTLSGNSEINELPQKYAENLVDMTTYFYQQEFLSVNESYYEMYGQYMWTDMETFYEQYYGMTAEDVMEAIEYNASQDAVYAMLCQAIYEERGLTYTEQDRMNFISGLGYAEEELADAVEAYGEGYLSQGAMTLAVNRYLEEIAVVTE